MSTVINVTNLSKKYTIGHQRRESYQTLREVISGKALDFGRRLIHPFNSSSGQPLSGAPDSEDFWALDKVSFNINQGERVGIVGRNGAGKSTLLKILSRITEPTAGQVKIKGRVASLLEVGTGFHPELTGRENVFLNGAILGMSRVEIKRKFDEIVDFAGVEKFLDTPVKRYSSGMHVRLGFSVAAHLESEILIIDEVLAVGDMQFQKKCFGKMKEVSGAGRTLLFVSHNMASIQRLCSRALLLDSGQISADDQTRITLKKYLKSGQEKKHFLMDLNKIGRRYESAKCNHIRLQKCYLVDSNGCPTHSLMFGEPLNIKIEVFSGKRFQNIKFVLGIETTLNERIFTADSEEFGFNFSADAGESFEILASFKGIALMPGDYRIGVASIRSGSIGYDTLTDLMQFEVNTQVIGGKSPPLVKTGFISGVSSWHKQMVSEKRG